MAYGALEAGARSKGVGLNQYLEYELDEQQRFSGIAMQEAIIADPAKPLGQDMLKHQPEEVFAIEGAKLSFAGVAVGGHVGLMGPWEYTGPN